jgi:hypothetical protein
MFERRRSEGGEAEDDLCALEVRELRPLDEPARLREQLDRLLHVARVRPRPGLAREDAHLELDGTARDDRLERLRELRDRAGEVALLGQRLGTGEDRFGAGPVVRRDAGREKGRVDPEPEREPIDRLGRRPGLPALDLRDVLLREALAGQFALGQPCGDAKLAQPLAEPGSPRDGRSDVSTCRHGARSLTHTPPNRNPWNGVTRRKPASFLRFWVNRPRANHLTELLDTRHFHSYSERTLHDGLRVFAQGGAPRCINRRRWLGRRANVSGAPRRRPA